MYNTPKLLIDINQEIDGGVIFIKNICLVHK